MAGTLRYTLLLDEAANQTVDRLQRVYGLRSKAAVFDLAATLLKWVSEQQEQGYRVGRSDGDQFNEVLLPTPITPTAEHSRPVTLQTRLTATGSRRLKAVDSTTAGKATTKRAENGRRAKADATSPR